MDTADHSSDLGGLVLLLHSFEFAIRLFLFHEAGAEPHVDLDEVSIGKAVPINALTDYRQLRALLGSYNDAVRSRDPGLVISSAADIISLRDALAHGRVYGRVFEPPFRLVKFSPQRPDGTVTMTFDATMDRPWFVAQRKLVRNAIEQVARAMAPYGAGFADGR